MPIQDKRARRHTFEIAIEEMAAALKSTPLSNRPAEHNQHIVKDLYFSWDNKSGDAQVKLSRTADELMTIEAKCSGEMRWFLLNFGLGSAAVDDKQVLSFILSGSAEKEVEMQGFIRSRSAQGRDDTKLQDRVSFSRTKPLSILIQQFKAADPITKAKDFHTLVLRLPVQDFKFTIHKMKFALVDGEKIARKSTPNFGEVAAT